MIDPSQLLVGRASDDRSRLASRRGTIEAMVAPHGDTHLQRQVQSGRESSSHHFEDAGGKGRSAIGTCPPANSRRRRGKSSPRPRKTWDLRSGCLKGMIFVGQVVRSEMSSSAGSVTVTCSAICAGPT